MKALALWFLVAIATTASGATKVGVVVPDEPYLAWMAKQFEIGTELAYRKLAQGDIDFTFEVVPLPSGLGSRGTIDALTDAIAAKGIDVVVAASTSATAEAFRHLDSHWKTPTVVVSPADPAAFSDPKGRNGYVIDLGVPLQVLQHKVLTRWQECYARDGLVIVYNKDFPWSSAFAAEIARAFPEKSPHRISWSDHEGPGSHDEVIDQVAHATAGTTDVGVILAGPPWNTDRWISSLALAGVEPPIYVGPLVSGPAELKDLASKTNSTIFTASDYWTNPADRSQKDFADAAAAMLGYSGNDPMTPIALKAHDAVVFIASAYTEGHIGQYPMAHWWQGLAPVKGIKGTLHQYDEALWGPPIDLLHIKPGGTVSFSDDPSDCPS